MRAPFLVLAVAALALPAAAKTPVLHVDGWARPTMPAQKASAAYLSIHNSGPGADRLLSISTPVAASASVHSTSTAGGVMRMRAVRSLPVAAGRHIRMKPGGLHVMLTGMRAPLRAGQKLPLTLRFERAGLVRATINVQTSGNSTDRHGQHGH